MDQRSLGYRTGLRVSRIALGTGRLGMTETGGTDAEGARRVFRAFAAAGGTFIDTSSAYQGGRAEEMTGAFLAEAGRDRFKIASKYGRTPQPEPSAASVGCHRGAMRAEVEGSLKRLGTDRIDLYLPHFDDGVTPVEEIMRGFEDLVRAGKILHVGLSNFPAWRIASAAMLAELRGWAPVAAVQLQYSLMARDADRDLLPLARARSLGVMGYSPLGGGGLNARARRRQSARNPVADASRTGEDAWADTVVDTLLRVAGELGCEPASVALAWVCSKDIIPVIGPRTLAQLEAGLTTVETLSGDQVRRLDEVSKPVLGYPHDLLLQARAHAGLGDGGMRAVL